MFSFIVLLFQGIKKICASSCSWQKIRDGGDGNFLLLLHAKAATAFSAS